MIEITSFDGGVLEQAGDDDACICTCISCAQCSGSRKATDQVEVDVSTG